LIKFKTRAYIDLGDKYYSVSKFLSAGKAYEKANFYYEKFSKKDKKITESIYTRIVNAYIKAADIMVKNSMNSEAIRYLRKAEKYAPENFELRYKIALVLSDSDPEEAAKYLETLLTKIPQHIDYSLWGRTLIKAANIADLDGRPTKSKYYRYKIHSIDLFMNRKVVYKDDFDVKLLSINTSKVLFTYPIKAEFQVVNNSSIDIINMSADFILNYKDEPVETITMKIADKDRHIYTNGGVSAPVLVKFKRNIFTQKELERYTIDVYLYKDEKYKTQIIRLKVPRAKNLAQKLLEDFK
jgi:tetratricopeptide (TPR) repeat protein